MLGSTKDESIILFRYIAPPSWPAVSCSNILPSMRPPESEYIEPPSFMAKLCLNIEEEIYSKVPLTYTAPPFIALLLIKVEPTILKFEDIEEVSADAT